MAKFKRIVKTRLAHVAVLIVALLGTSVVAAQPAYAGDSTWPCGPGRSGFICLYNLTYWRYPESSRYTEDWCGPGWGVKFSIDSWFWDKTQCP